MIKRRILLITGKMKVSNYCRAMVICVTMFLLVNIFQCGSRGPTQKSDTIDIKHQNVYLRPLEGIDMVKTSTFWPENRDIEKILLEYMQEMWNNLLVEFRRCEKYGLYKMVDSSGAPTVVITVKIGSSKIRNDTLSMPVTIKTFIKSMKQTYTLSVDAYGIGSQDSTSESNQLYYLGAMFADYKRKFPYQKAVSAFYIQNQ